MTTAEQKRKLREEKKQAGIVSPLHVCPVCSVTYTRKHRLTDHMKKHLDSINTLKKQIDEGLDAFVKQCRSFDEEMAPLEAKNLAQLNTSKKRRRSDCFSCTVIHLSGSMVSCDCQAEQEDEAFQLWREEKLQSIREARAALQENQK